MKLPKIKRINIFSIIFILLFVLLFSFVSLANYAGTPVNESKAVYTVDVPRGASFARIVDILYDAGIIKYRPLFYLLAFTQQAAGRIKAGEYEFTNSSTPLEMINKMIRGDIKAYLVTFPEDITLKEVAARLATYRLADEETFLKLSRNRDFLTSLGIEGDSLEGYLYPDTYLLDRSMETRGVIRIMVRQFWKKVTPELRARARQRGFTIQELVTLASIIGKESGNKEEKPLIAAVFNNRLKKGMKLQSDPTAVYGLPDFSGAIKRRHLNNSTPHNTYYIKGLPPTPIANPGLDSLRAALDPAPVNYLYFVSQNDGTHYFSSDFSAHNEAVSRYQNNKQKE